MKQKQPFHKRILWSVLRFVVYLFFDIRIEGDMHPGERVILAPNHASFFDPFVVAASYPDDLSILAKKELFENKILKFFLERLEVVSVDRGNIDLGSLRQMIEYAKDKSLLIFPEGTRNKVLTEPLPGKSGTIMLSHKTGLPIQPVAITKKAHPFQRIKLIYLPLVHVEDYGFERLNSKAYQTIADDILKKIYERIELEHHHR
ncbi:lysophospholipid acyltransferase family protein [Guggenheimella bovis]